MARIKILAVMLVVALFGVPTTAAFLPSTTGDGGDLQDVVMNVQLPWFNEVTDAVLVDGSGVVDAATQTADDVATQVDANLEGLLCTKAVKVTRIGYGGKYTDERDGQYSYLRTRDVVTSETIERVPVYRTVTKTVFEPARVLGLGLDLGFELEPVTKEVTELVRVDERVVPTIKKLDVAVDLKWTERYTQWERVVATGYVTLVVGSPLLATGQGELVDVCGDEPIRNRLPWFDRSGYDRFTTLRHPVDGWSTYVRDVSARVAGYSDYESLPWFGQDSRQCPLPALRLGEERSEQLQPTAVQWEAQDRARQRLGEAAHVEVRDDADAAPASATPGTQVHVPATTGLVLAAFLAVVATAIGLAGRYVVRRVRHTE